MGKHKKKTIKEKHKPHKSRQLETQTNQSDLVDKNVLCRESNCVDKMLERIRSQVSAAIAAQYGACLSNIDDEVPEEPCPHHSKDFSFDCQAKKKHKKEKRNKEKKKRKHRDIQSHEMFSDPSLLHHQKESLTEEPPLVEYDFAYYNSDDGDDTITHPGLRSVVGRQLKQIPSTAVVLPPRPNSPSSGWFRHQHDDRDRHDYDGKLKFQQYRRPGSTFSSYHPFSKNILPAPVKSRKAFTGYQYSNEREKSPMELGEFGFSESPPSPPRRTPEHIRWLHQRWKSQVPEFASTSGQKAPSLLTTTAAQNYHKSDDVRRHSRSRSPYSVSNRRSSEMHSRDARKDSRSRRSYSRERSPRRTGFHKPYFEYCKWKRGEMESTRMMTFKEFLMSLPDDKQECDADEEEQQKRMQGQYNDYRLKFKKNAFSGFFEAHCGEEWFREKYHPAYKLEPHNRRILQVQRRLDVFMQLLVQGWIEAPLDFTVSRQLRKTMDAAAVLLEGGQLSDLAELNDLDYIFEEKREEEQENPLNTNADLADRERPNATELEAMQHAKDYTLFIKEKLIPGPDGPDLLNEEDLVETGQVPDHIGCCIHKAIACVIDLVPPSVTRAELEEICYRTHAAFLRLHLTSPDPARRYARQAIVSYWYNANIPKIAWKLRGWRLRGVPLVVQEYKCPTERRDNALFHMRARLNQILIESKSMGIEHLQHFIKKIRNGLKFKKENLSIFLEHLRFTLLCIRTCDGFVADRLIVLKHIQMAKALIEKLDFIYDLWVVGKQTEDGEDISAQCANRNDVVFQLNPLFLGLEDAIAQNSVVSFESPEKPATINKDQGLTKILDRLLLYLRIVHSVDWYTAEQWEFEDDQPRRLYSITCRGSVTETATEENVEAYMKEFDDRLKLLLNKFTDCRLADEHIQLLGKRDRQPEMDRFAREMITTTHDKLFKCGLCYKRFTSEQFASMHIVEKHAAEMDMAGQEVDFFNNYLADPQRPCTAAFV